MNAAKKNTPPKKKQKDSLFKRINNWLHLWLGLISGVIVLIVCLTGCIWVFNEEIDNLLHPENLVERQDKPVLTPSQLTAIASNLYPDKTPAYAHYHQGEVINLSLRDKKEKGGRGGGGRRGGGVQLKVNPYTGEVISNTVRKPGETDFFRFILNGHRFLWMPYEIGRPIVNYGTLVFVVLLITGLIWWYPKKWNKSTVDKSFKIKWGASFKRVNLDLHNVLGFYSLLFLLAIAITGMVYGIKWWSEGLYWVTSGGEKMAEYRRMESDSLQAGKFYKPLQAMDAAWAKVVAKHPKSMGFYYSFPEKKRVKATIDITVYPSAGQFYNSQGYSFDQHTLKELKREDAYSVAYADATVGQKIRKMNYDIHVGSILGFPGKVLAFLASLIGASLPITGFLVWYGRKFKKKKPKTLPLKPAETQETPLLKPKLMKNITTIIIGLLLSFSSTQLFAHALWIETAATGKIGQKQTVKVFYGEYAANERENIDKWYSDVKEFSLWLVGPDQKKTQLTVAAVGDNSFEASFTPEQNGSYALLVSHEAKELGGTTKYHFLASAHVAVGKAASAAQNTNALRLHAENAQGTKVNKPVQLKAFLNDAAAKGKTVSVFSPSGWSKELHTNDNGDVEFIALWPGRYVIEVSDFDKTPGQHHGKDYKAVWKGATYSFIVE